MATKANIKAELKTQPTTAQSTGSISITQDGKSRTTPPLTLGQSLIQEYEQSSFQDGKQRLDWLSKKCNYMLHEMARSRYADRLLTAAFHLMAGLFDYKSRRKFTERKQYEAD